MEGWRLALRGDPLP